GGRKKNQVFAGGPARLPALPPVGTWCDRRRPLICVGRREPATTFLVGESPRSKTQDAAGRGIRCHGQQISRDQRDGNTEIPPMILSDPPGSIVNGKHPSLLDTALAGEARGWSMLFVVGKTAQGLGRWGHLKERRADPTELRRMCARPGITGVAVITGAV